MTITKSKIAMAEGILDGKKAIFQINFQRQVAHSLDLFTSVAPLEGADCRRIAAVVDALFPWSVSVLASRSLLHKTQNLQNLRSSAQTTVAQSKTPRAVNSAVANMKQVHSAMTDMA